MIFPYVNGNVSFNLADFIHDINSLHKKEKVMKTFFLFLVGFFVFLANGIYANSQTNCVGRGCKPQKRTPPPATQDGDFLDEGLNTIKIDLYGGTPIKKQIKLYGGNEAKVVKHLFGGKKQTTKQNQEKSVVVVVNNTINGCCGNCSKSKKEVLQLQNALQKKEQQRKRFAWLLHLEKQKNSKLVKANAKEQQCVEEAKQGGLVLTAQNVSTPSSNNNNKNVVLAQQVTNNNYWFDFILNVKVDIKIYILTFLVMLLLWVRQFFKVQNLRTLVGVKDSEIGLAKNLLTQQTQKFESEKKEFQGSLQTVALLQQEVRLLREFQQKQGDEESNQENGVTIAELDEDTAVVETTPTVEGPANNNEVVQNTPQQIVVNVHVHMHGGNGENVVTKTQEVVEASSVENQQPNNSNANSGNGITKYHQRENSTSQI